MRVLKVSGRPTVVVALVAGLLVGSPFAVAATGDAIKEAVRNGTATGETEIIGRLDAKSGKGGYVTRQSNIAEGAKAGGAAIYGCRTPVGGTLSGSAPCLRASNLSGGSAFEFSSTAGAAGLISVGDPKVPNPGKPFVTNATGVATGLNADKVDGKDASELTGATGPAGPAGPAGAAGAPGPAGPSELRVAVDDTQTLATCTDDSFATCADIAPLSLPAGNWLLQAKLLVDNNGGAATNSRCGLVQGNTKLDEVRFTLAANGSPGQNEAVALTAVAADQPASTYAVRCTEPAAATLQTEDIKLTALRVGSVVGP